MARQRYGAWVAAATQPCVADVQIPQTRAEALSSPFAEYWREAELAELQAIEDSGTWRLKKPPSGRKPLPCKWVYTVKGDKDGNVVRFKARLVAKGCSQRAGLDYDELFAPTVTRSALRLVLALAAHYDLEIRQVDFTSAFLNWDLAEEVWMQQPEGYGDRSSGLACCLLKSLYGLKQAPHAWHQKLRAALTDMGFAELPADPSMFLRWDKGGPTVLVLHVDDMLITGPADAGECVVQQLRSRFELRDLGDASVFLGWEIEGGRERGTMHVSQSKLAVELLEKFGMSDARPAVVPMPAGVKLQPAGEGERLSDAQASEFRALVGGLQYLATCTRPDLAQSASALARFAASPGREHMALAKGVLRYLAGTREFGLEYGPHGSPQLRGYCDSDWAGDVEKRKSTSGYVFMLHGGPVSWSSKLQATVACSSFEAEYAASSYAVREAV